MKNFDHTKPLEINNFDPNYISLIEVFKRSYKRAAVTKGKERHAENNRFDDQPICVLNRWYGYGHGLGQANKKMKECLRLSKQHRINQLLDAINYLAGVIIVVEEEPNDD